MTHSHAHEQNERRLFWTAMVTGAFMIVEALGGIIGGSLALLADAGHMLLDVAGLLLAWLAFRAARWPADTRRTYGFERLQVLAAFANAVTLFILAFLIVLEALHRLFEPEPVLGGVMLVIAVVGLFVNAGIYMVLRGGDHENLNVRGALIHVMGDFLGSVGAIAAAIIILTTGWTQADPLVSILVSVVILRSAWHVGRDAAHILLEGAPTTAVDHDIKAMLKKNIAGLEDVHHLHVWSITQERPMLTMHAVIAKEANSKEVVVAIKTYLRTELGIAHATIEVEQEGCADEIVSRIPAQSSAHQHAHADAHSHPH